MHAFSKFPMCEVRSLAAAQEPWPERIVVTPTFKTAHWREHSLLLSSESTMQQIIHSTVVFVDIRCRVHYSTKL